MLFRISAVVVTLLASVTIASAHTPLCSCFDNGDNTITCEGGFSDGSSASGVAMHIQAANGKVLLEGKMNENSEFTFPKPQGDYVVAFDGGDGHQIKVPGNEIAK